MKPAFFGCENYYLLFDNIANIFEFVAIISIQIIDHFCYCSSYPIF